MFFIAFQINTFQLLHAFWDPKATQKLPRGAPGTPQGFPRVPKVAPTVSQEAPKAPPRSARGPQGTPRDPPRVLGEHPWDSKAPQGPTRTLNDPQGSEKLPKRHPTLIKNQHKLIKIIPEVIKNNIWHMPSTSDFHFDCNIHIDINIDVHIHYVIDIHILIDAAIGFVWFVFIWLCFFGVTSPFARQILDQMSYGFVIDVHIYMCCLIDCLYNVLAWGPWTGSAGVAKR